MELGIIAFLFSLICAGLDYYCTKRNKLGGGKEKNPLFRNKDGTANMEVILAASLGVQIAYWFGMESESSYIFGFIYGAWRLYGAWTNFNAPGFRRIVLK